MRWMLDTDTCIELIRKRSLRVLDSLREKTVGEVGLSAITVAELRFGVAKSSRAAENAAALEQFLMPLELAAFDEAAAGAYGAVRHELERSGRGIGSMDTLIAAHALSLDATLVSHNMREFRRVKGLRVEDWTK